MSIEAGRAVTEPFSPRPKIAIVIALGIERACLESELDDDPSSSIVLYQSGPGATRAAEAARTAVKTGASALVSWGLAGGLEPELKPGTVVIPQRILVSSGSLIDTDRGWQARLVAALQSEFIVHEGDLLVSERLLATPRSKARAALDSGAVAVDMESAAIATVAEEADLPVIAVRVVADGLADTLPADVSAWIDADGRRRLTPLFGAVFKPSQWSTLATLARRSGIAQHTLTNLARLLVPTGFEFVPQSSRDSS